MANRTGKNPIYIDQFNADVTLATNGQSFIVKKIRLLSATQYDLFSLENFVGDVLFKMENTVGAAHISEVNFGDDGFDFGNEGVVIDYTDCTGLAATDGTDAVWIYLK